MDGPEVAGSQRHCRISGARSARSAAKAEIYKIIEDNEQSKRGSSAGGDKSRPPNGKPAVSASKDGDSLQMMVPDRTVGLIIGRGGETIRDLQDRSGCHVNIVGENKSVNGFRPVNLIGSAAAQQYAKDLILEIVESDQKGVSVKDLHRDRDDGGHGKINDTIVVPGEAVGMIIGKGMPLTDLGRIDLLTVGRQVVNQYVTCRIKPDARSTCPPPVDVTLNARLD